MAKKVIALKEPTIIEIQFLDGKTFEASFNMRAIRIITEEFGNFLDVVKGAVSNIPETTAKILYGMLKSKNEDITYEDVQAVVEFMSLDDAMDIIGLCTEGMNSKVPPEELKKTVAEILGMKR